MPAEQNEQEHATRQHQSVGDQSMSSEQMKAMDHHAMNMAPPKTFIEEQKREMLANRLRLLLRGGVNVSLDEVKNDFLRRGNQVNVEYVRFSTRRYENEIEPTQAEIEAFAKSNEVKILKKFARDIRKKLPMDPIQKLKSQLDRALQREAYEEAARIRDEIKRKTQEVE